MTAWSPPRLRAARRAELDRRLADLEEAAQAAAGLHAAAGPS
ncbi:hypothetical protein [Methylobacterium sp. WL1]|nr:hypothetical protein [Methylobacterium sp. WL1]